MRKDHWTAVNKKRKSQLINKGLEKFSNVEDDGLFDNKQFRIRFGANDVWGI